MTDKELVKIECYIEEYNNGKGLCARLRDKKTNKKVSLDAMYVSKMHLLRFLSQAKLHQEVMPTVYDRNGKDIVAVRGYIVEETKDEIVICTNIIGGGYLFE